MRRAQRPLRRGVDVTERPLVGVLLQWAVTLLRVDYCILDILGPQMKQFSDRRPVSGAALLAEDGPA